MTIDIPSEYTPAEQAQHRLELADAFINGGYAQTCGNYWTLDRAVDTTHEYTHHCAVGVAFDVMGQALGYPKFVVYPDATFERYYGIFPSELIYLNEIDNGEDVNLTFPEIGDMLKNGEVELSDKARAHRARLIAEYKETYQASFK